VVIAEGRGVARDAAAEAELNPAPDPAGTASVPNADIKNHTLPVSVAWTVSVRNAEPG